MKDDSISNNRTVKNIINDKYGLITGNWGFLTGGIPSYNHDKYKWIKNNIKGEIEMDKVNDLTFNTKSDASEVLLKLKNLIRKYGYVTVRDVLTECGIPSENTDKRYGWKNLDSAAVFETRDNERWRIEFPEPLILNKKFCASDYQDGYSFSMSTIDEVATESKKEKTVSYCESDTKMTEEYLKKEMFYPDCKEKITITMPYTDTYIGMGAICPKDVLLKGYLDELGKNIDFNGKPKKVVEVRLTEKYIFVDLE